VAAVCTCSCTRPRSSASLMTNSAMPVLAGTLDRPFRGSLSQDSGYQLAPPLLTAECLYESRRDRKKQRSKANSPEQRRHNSPEQRTGRREKERLAPVLTLLSARAARRSSGKLLRPCRLPKPAHS
jgi:hypothetical protein